MTRKKIANKNELRSPVRSLGFAIPQYRLLLVCSFLLRLLAWPATDLLAAPDVVASIDKEEAWIGEAVTIVIKLYSPGPFSGTASFDIPELPLTTILKYGTPVVGSETVDDESLLTQTHEFKLYTQNVGTVELPPIPIRFSSKESFVGEPINREGSTAKLQFDSKRPPGSEQLGVVVAAQKIELAQSWSLEEERTLRAGDVVQRRVTQQTADTTSMMLPVVSAAAGEGVRIYTSPPQVFDKLERGTLSAERTDNIKYLFESPGTYELPAIEVVWWDPASSELKTASVAGRTFVVEQVVEAAEVKEMPQPWYQSLVAPLLCLGIFAALAWWFRVPVSNYVNDWRANRKSLEAIYARQVMNACRTNDAPNAYVAMLSWRRETSSLSATSAINTPPLDPANATLELEWAELEQNLFGQNPPIEQWSGKRLGEAFERSRKKRKQQVQGETNAFPPLNPENV